MKIPKIKLHISQILKNMEKMLSGSLCKKNEQFAETVIHGSSLGRNQFGTKIGKLNKHVCFFNYWLQLLKRLNKRLCENAWPGTWPAPDHDHDLDHDLDHDHDLGHDLDHDLDHDEDEKAI